MAEMGREAARQLKPKPAQPPTTSEHQTASFAETAIPLLRAE
jgi:hypothetical protein